MPKPEQENFSPAPMENAPVNRAELIMDKERLPEETREAETSGAPEAEPKKPSKFKLPTLRKTPTAARDATLLKVEKIMEEGLNDAYARLSPIARQEFKLKGEETARAVRELLNAAHVRVKKIFRLIYEWLKLLPGVNRFFLEQEAKIKTDKIITLKKRRPFVKND